MSRYFIEVFYKGTAYAGFQVQRNANSIQAEIEKALRVFFRSEFVLTGSSRTDSGVHAFCNYFHFDSDVIPNDFTKRAASIYNLNAILPLDIVIKSISEVKENAHCRFDAISREYRYFIYSKKDPFKADRAFYYPYTLDVGLLNEAARLVLSFQDFTAFSKRNTQVKSFNCSIYESNWSADHEQLVYTVRANRFLRGMVKGLVGTMLRVGTGKISLDEFKKIIEGKDCSVVDFSVPAHGLFLFNVEFKSETFNKKSLHE
jgi:tRNA pseudouridine38-40 synthase